MADTKISESRFGGMCQHEGWSGRHWPPVLVEEKAGIETGICAGEQWRDISGQCEGRRRARTGWKKVA